MEKMCVVQMCPRQSCAELSFSVCAPFTGIALARSVGLLDSCLSFLFEATNRCFSDAGVSVPPHLAGRLAGGDRLHGTNNNSIISLKLEHLVFLSFFLLVYSP